MAKTKTIARTEVRHRKRAADQEQMMRLLILGGVVLVIAIAAGIIGFGWYQTHIKPLGKTVLQVGNTKYSLGALERRMELLRDQSSSYYDGQRILLLPGDTIDQLTQEAKMLQAAGQLKITISDEEFATAIKEQGNVSEDAAPDVYASAYRDQWKQSGLHEGEFRDMIEAQLLQEKLSEYFRFVAKPSEAEIKANYAIIDTKEKADGIVTRVRAGEDFDTVAKDVTSNNGAGDLDWSPRGAVAFLPQVVDDYLFDTAVTGQVSDTIEADGLFYVVLLTEKDPNRTLDDRGRQLAGARDMQKWLDDLNITVVNSLSDEDKNRALEDIL